MTTDQTNEVWLPIIGHESEYKISDHGRIISLRKFRRTISGYFTQEKILKNYLKNGYPVLAFRMNGKRKEKYIHRLVCQTFLGDQDGREVNHKNGIRTDNRLINLEWVSHSENIKHAYDTGLESPYWKGRVTGNASPVIAVNQTAIIEFPSIHRCAKYIGGREHTIRRKMDHGIEVNGYLIYSI